MDIELEFENSQATPEFTAETSAPLEMILEAETVSQCTISTDLLALYQLSKL